MITFVLSKGNPLAHIDMKVLLGKKSHMTQYFDVDGTVHPVTVLTDCEVTVTRVKSESTDGYKAVQVGHGETKPERLSKSVLGNLKGMKPFSFLKEFRATDDTAYEIGQILGADTFTAGDVVQVSGISKGKGFQGVVKRHGFKGKGPIHNAHHALREPGSIAGGGRAGGRVAKGMKMAGRMGSDRTTVTGLRIIAVDPETKTLLVKGAVPGVRGSIIEIVQK